MLHYKDLAIGVFKASCYSTQSIDAVKVWAKSRDINVVVGDGIIG